MKLRLCLLISASLQACANQTSPLPPVVAPNEVPNLQMPSSPSALEAMNDMTSQVELLQQEVRRLQGAMEEQAFKLEALDRRQAALYQDLDLRLQETGSGFETPSLGEVQAADPGLEVKSRTQATETVEASTDDKMLYRQAYNTLKQGQYQQAIDQFQTFLSQHPDSDYSDNAQYWIGESYLVLDDKPAAQTAFALVAKNYPTSDKVRDALLKLGYIALDQGQPAKAKALFEQIMQHYPNTTAAHLAEKKLQTVK